MLSVEQALERILGAMAPLPAEQISVADGLGRVLAQDIVARRTQPPAAMSAMDGYAVRAQDVAQVPVTLKVVGQAPAGGAWQGTLGEGEAVRIFTGGPVPDGADTIIMQENTEAADGAVTVLESAPKGRFVRPAGLDFSEGDVLLPAGRLLTARDVALAAAMNTPWIMVHRRPRVAILATGDEVVMPGDPMTPNQIISSNSLGMAAMVKVFGGEPCMLGIAPDDREALAAMAAGAKGADLLLTSGGASVGDHDLVQSVLGEIGFELGFWKIAMRPGKPLIFGHVGDTPVLGLPGNPVSALVCAILFLRPALTRMLGMTTGDDGHTATARLTEPLGKNDERQDYLRGALTNDENGELSVTPFTRQDSSMLNMLAQADCLVMRPPHAPALAAGERVPVIPLPGALYRA
ncbi:MAG: molybdopterin molybdotransferase MoeA [Alphaproteobacteria bacterium]|nr:molybdopterin molybdotransferase MoeA [Alphaproteobacteria bacterium]